MKIIAVCGNGSGSSLIMEMMIKDVIKNLGLDATVEHVSLNAWSESTACDIVFCGMDLFDQIKVGTNTKKIGLLNIVDKNEITKKITEVL